MKKKLHPAWGIVIFILAMLVYFFGRIVWVHWYGSYVSGSESFWDSLTLDVWLESLVVLLIGSGIAIFWMAARNGKNNDQ